MKKFLVAIIVVTICATMTNAQTGDTVIVELAKTSRVIFTIKDKSDLEILKHYDFQQLFEDVLLKLEKRDTTALATRDSTEADIAAGPGNDYNNEGENDHDEDIEEQQP